MQTYIYISIINLSCLSVCVSLTMRPAIKMLRTNKNPHIQKKFKMNKIELSVCLCLTNYASDHQNVDMGHTYEG